MWQSRLQVRRWQSQPQMARSQPHLGQNQRHLSQKQLRNQLRSQRQERLLRPAPLLRRMQNRSRSQLLNPFQPTEACGPRLRQQQQGKHDLNQWLLQAQLVKHL